MIDKHLLEVLRCPQDHSALQLADKQLIERINRGIRTGTVVNAGGHRVEQCLDGGLIRKTGDVLYPIVDEIPVMLPDEAIALSQFQDE